MDQLENSSLHTTARSFCLFLILSVCTISCRKEEPAEPLGPPDYREQFVGQYSVVRTCSSWGGAGWGSSTEADTVHVSIVAGTSDSIAVDMTYIPIDPSGYYYDNPFSYNYYEVEFWGDSIQIGFASGGLGGGTDCGTSGKRIDRL